jgi:acyl-CoA thioester hydrolase
MYTIRRRQGVTDGDGVRGDGFRPTAFKRSVAIRWRDMDALGHVNNAVYLTYIEEAHDEFLRQTVGDGDGSAHVVVARVEIDFLTQLTQEDGPVTASCRLESLGNSSLRTKEELITVGGRTAARARSVMVKVARDTGEPASLTDAERRSLTQGRQAG